MTDDLTLPDVSDFSEPFAKNVRWLVRLDAQPDDDLRSELIRGPVEGYGANRTALEAATGPLFEPTKGLGVNSQGPRDWPRRGSRPARK